MEYMLLIKGGILTVLGAVFGYSIGAFVKLYGSKQHREASTKNAAEEWQQLYEETKKENKELKAEIASLTGQVKTLMSRVQSLEAMCSSCNNKPKKSLGVHDKETTLKVFLPVIDPSEKYSSSSKQNKSGEGFYSVVNKKKE